MDLVYGIPGLTALLVALAYVRHVARRDRRRASKRKRPPSRAMRSLSQRSEMRAGEDAITVMDQIRTHSKPALKDATASQGKSTKPRRKHR